MDNKSSFLLPVLASGLAFASLFAQAEAITDPDDQTPATTQEQLQSDSGQTAELSSIIEVEPYQKFVTERLYVFIHSGSSTEYRIIGRAAAGEELTVISRDTESGWLKIEQSNGRTGWVDNSVLVDNSGSRGQLVAAQEKITELEAKLKAQAESSSDEALTQLNNEVGNLTLTNEELTRQLNELQEQNAQIDVLKAKNLELENSIVKTDQTQKILEKLYDAGTVILGVFVGWLITRRRKSSLSFDRL